MMDIANNKGFDETLFSKYVRKYLLSKGGRHVVIEKIFFRPKEIKEPDDRYLFFMYPFDFENEVTEWR
jgi:hypothetical protein